MSDEGKDRPQNRGQERSEEARQAARDRGAKAHGPGGNPDKGGDDDAEVTEPVDDGTADDGTPA